MKKRYLYALLFGIPGFFISLIISFSIFGMTTGVYWVYVFGDNPWPSWTNILLPIFFGLVFLLVWIAYILLGYVTGRRLEDDPRVNKYHILISGGFTLLFFLLILLQQFGVGNLGPKSDSALCSDYCVQNGYSASGLPPRDSGDRTCSCYDDSGNEVLQTPLNAIDFDTPK